MELTYRAATLGDAELASDIMHAAYPALSSDPVMTRLRWSWGRDGFSFGRYIVERGGAPVAFLGWSHGPWDQVSDHYCEIEAWLDRGFLERDLLTELWSWIEQRGLDEGAQLLLAYAGEDELEMLEVLAALGYERARLEKAWELDLSEHGARIVEDAAAARIAMQAAGIRLLPLAAWDDRARVEKLHVLNERTMQDAPHTVRVPETLHDFEKRLNGPDRPHDRYWIALDGDRPVAVSYLKYPPVRGAVWTGFTATDASHRGRGIAKAVKLQTLAQAVELGVPVVLTDNDSENAPMLHINERLGYRRRPGFVEHHKRVTNTRHG